VHTYLLRIAQAIPPLSPLAPALAPAPAPRWSAQILCPSLAAWRTRLSNKFKLPRRQRKA